MQVVFNPETAPDAHARSHELRSEWVISVQGEVVRRSAETVNPDMPTGEIEVRATALEVLAAAETPPFPLDEDTAVDEALRLRHRYLDLRREPMQRALELRHRVTQAIRDHLNAAGFLDIETPILTRSTPEGARDFVVPSRMQRGAFYALPQSPQLFKQLLMIAGFERYYQIARCFRDEDLRADRQLEFTQLDLEMAFVHEEDVMAVTEGVLAAAFAAGGVELATPFPRLPYDDAIARFGTDRPDMRFGMEIRDLGDALRDTEFKVFRGVLESGGVVRGINAGAHELSRAELDRLIEFAQGQGAGGLVWAYVEEGRRLALSGGEVPLRAGAAGDRRRARGLAGRPAAAGRRRGRGRGPDARRAAARAGGAVRPDRGGRVAPAVGDRLPAGRVERRRGPLGCAAPSLHLADRGVARAASRTTPPRRARAPTTWC